MKAVKETRWNGVDFVFRHRNGTATIEAERLLPYCPASSGNTRVSAGMMTQRFPIKK